jgi:hypothetical protein
MYVVANLFDIFISVGVEVFPGLALVPCTLDSLKHVGDHANGDERMPVIIEVNTPGITGSF